jgi:Zn-dependent protease with chaperone function
MFSVSLCIATVLAVAPAFVTWWEYRRLASGGESAVLTERVAQVRSRVGAASGIAAALILVGFADTAVWAIPLLLVALAGASHGPRRRLFGETWSFAGYLEWRARIVVGTIGFWIVLAFTPAIVMATPHAGQSWVAAILFVGLIAWHHGYARILLLVLNATPLQRADLEPFFTHVFQRTTAIVPTVWRAGAQGGVFANALALPATGQGRVLFFDTLLERLAPNEIAAILAHEVAHLEHFHVRMLRRMYLATTAAIAVIVAGSATLAALAPAHAWMATAFCPVAVFAGLAVRARRMQAEETSSDRRAAALCGDPEALVGALTRLHEIHHVPRRLSPDVEQHATHPSLARRIRDIRGNAVERLPQELSAPAVLMSSEPGRLAILEPERFTLVWAAPDAPGLVDDPIGVAKRIEARTYDQLTELRLSTAADGHAVLTARAIDGCRWRVPLQPGEAARAQGALNVVDQLLAPPVATRHDVSHRAVAAVTLVLTAVLKTLGPIVVPAVLAVARPTPQLCATLACALLATAFTIGADSRLDALRVLALALLAAAAMWQSYRVKEGSTATASTQAPRLEAAALAIPVILGLAWTAVTSHDLFGLHATVRDTAWPTASLMALTVYMGTSNTRALRRAGAGVGALTAAAVFVGSSTFLSAIVRDPLVATTAAFVEQTVLPTPLSSTTVDGQFDRVRLAPDGKHFLLSEAADRENETETRQHVIGAFDGWSRPVEAVDAELVGADRVLLVGRAGGDTQLWTERFRGAVAPSWALKVRGLEAFGVAAASDGRWQLMNRRRNAFTRVDGRVGTSSTSRTKWHVQVEPTEYVSLHGAGAGNVGMGLAVEYRAPMLPWWLSAWTWSEKTTLVRVDSDATRRVATSSLNVACADPAPDASAHLCVAFDGRVSHFWRYDAELDRLQPIGRARGQFFVGARETSTTLAAMRAGSVVGIDVAAARITTYRLDGTHVTDYDLTDELLVVSSIAGDRTVVKLYRLPEPAPPGTFASRH